MDQIIEFFALILIAAWLIVGLGKVAGTPSFSDDDFIEFFHMTLVLLFWPWYPRKNEKK